MSKKPVFQKINCLLIAVPKMAKFSRQFLIPNLWNPSWKLWKSWAHSLDKKSSTVKRFSICSTVNDFPILRQLINFESVSLFWAWSYDKIDFSTPQSTTSGTLPNGKYLRTRVKIGTSFLPWTVYTKNECETIAYFALFGI